MSHAALVIDELADNPAARNAAGWDTCLDRLSGLVPASDSWCTRFECYRANFEPLIGSHDVLHAGYKGGSDQMMPGGASR